jgi:hypothetical protein
MMVKIPFAELTVPLDPTDMTISFTQKKKRKPQAEWPPKRAPESAANGGWGNAVRQGNLTLNLFFPFRRNHLASQPRPRPTNRSIQAKGG